MNYNPLLVTTAKEYLLFQAMTQALYFGLDAETIQGLAKTALERSEHYIHSVVEADKVVAR